MICKNCKKEVEAYLPSEKHELCYYCFSGFQMSIGRIKNAQQ